MVRMREELGRAEDELELEFLHLDLASFSSTKQFVASFKQKDCPLHILINNAGIGLVPFGEAPNPPLFHPSLQSCIVYGIISVLDLLLC